ncbi:hypothetical protein D0T85_09130 [Bacteroides sp. 519]|nr:hypothetical protein [Bacteroides sp. 519]
MYCVSASKNDLVDLLHSEGYKVTSFPTIQEAIESTPKDGVLLIFPHNYPQCAETLSADQVTQIAEKNLHVYAEYTLINSDTISGKPLTLERVVVTDSLFFPGLSSMELLNINGSYLLPAQTEHPLLVVARVAGFDRAVYGLSDTEVHPLLYQYNHNILLSTAPLSRFASVRFTPERSWRLVWQAILSSLTSGEVLLNNHLSYLSSAFDESQPLPTDARLQSARKGIEWFYNGHFLIHPSWKKDYVDQYIGDGSMPVGPPLPANAPNGDGSMGVLEGHCSFIYHDGSQRYRYWIRNDVQGESAMAFALAARHDGNTEHAQVAKNLLDYAFETFFIEDKSQSPLHGLMGWAITAPQVFYGDDNARFILGVLAAAPSLGENRWNRMLIENIVANFRTTGLEGFRGDRLEGPDMVANGLKHYQTHSLVSPHPHFESWLWACYLWLYNQTGYEPLLNLAKTGIRHTMKAYPSQWKWTNGIQQERARMILPLAWLVRVEPTDEHLGWLNFMVDELLINQVKSGAIREELGDAAGGMFGRTKSNSQYGKHEAPLIHENGDPVADLLYTNNFAFIGLHEAAEATGNPKHKEAVARLSDFMTRAQVRSERFKDIDGAWFRAFNYQEWDYWASNADAGWGVWSTLTGWIQSWIVSTQYLIEMETSLWDIANQMDIKQDWETVKSEML